MKKKWIVLGSTIGISSIVMISTGFSAMANTSGYDAYKSALKNTKAVQSVTMQTSADLQDNGKSLLSATGSFKLALDTKTASGIADLIVNGTQQTFNAYKQEGQTVLKSSANDVYYVKQEGAEKHIKKKIEDNDQISGQVETVIDALVGNLKDYVTVDAQTDGSKAISIQLDNTQIPAVVNALAPLAVKEASKHKHENYEQGDKQTDQLFFQKELLKNAAPQLTQEIKIEKVAVKAAVNESNFIQHQEADLTVSGKDDNGVSHQVTLHLQVELSDFNSSTPDTVDLNGKNVQTLQKSNHHDENE